MSKKLKKELKKIVRKQCDKLYEDLAEELPNVIRQHFNDHPIGVGVIFYEDTCNGLQIKQVTALQGVQDLSSAEES